MNTLADDKTYQETDVTLEDVKRKVSNTLNKLNLDGKIPTQMMKNLTVKDTRISKVQGNPKTHKDGSEIRLIINSRNSPTINIA